MNIGIRIIEVLIVFKFGPYCKDFSQSFVYSHKNSVDVLHCLRSNWQVTFANPKGVHKSPFATGVH